MLEAFLKISTSFHLTLKNAFPFLRAPINDKTDELAFFLTPTVNKF